MHSHGSHAFVAHPLGTGPVVDETSPDAAALATARRQLFVDLRGGFTLPVAGGLYWTALGLLGTQVGLRTWILVAFIGSGLIFPLAGLLGKLAGVRLMDTANPLSRVALQAVIGINLLWPVHIALLQAAPEVVPLSLAVGMALHWPVIGWMFGSRVCLAHAVVRVLGAAAIWYALPDGRLTVLPAFVAVCYALSVLARKA